MNLKFDEDPKYAAYAQLFEALCGPGPQRPIQMEASTTKVGQKRPRDATEDEATQDIVSACLLADSSLPAGCKSLGLLTYVEASRAAMQLPLMLASCMAAML